jgi:hypothetical protein
MDLKSSSLKICRHQASLVPNEVQRKGSKDSLPASRTLTAFRISILRHILLALFALLSFHAAHSQQVQQLHSRIHLSAQTAQGPARTGAIFTVQVAGAEPANSDATVAAPSGSVSFMNGETSIGAALLDSQGRASLTIAALPAGEQKITAIYMGDENFEASNSAPAVINADASGVPGFTLSTSNSSLTVAAGFTATTVITATPQNGFNQAVSLSCSGAPYVSVTCVFSPAQVTPGAATTANPNGTPAISTLSITTTAYTGGALREPGLHPRLGGSDTVYAVVAPGMLALAGLGLARRRRSRGKAHRASKMAAVLFLLVASGIGLSSCSQRYGYFHRPPEGNPGTPAGTYTVVITGITGTGSSLSTASVQLTLKVTT